MTLKILNGLDVQNQRIQNVGSASSSTDAAQWGQVQNLVNGLSWKQAVRVASTGVVNITSPGASIDGVTLNNGDRVLLKNQTTGSQNGLYTFNGASSSMGLTPDGMNGEFGPNTTVYVEEGTVNADTAWTCTTNAPITIGVTSLAFAQVGGGNVYTAGSGLTLTSGTFAIDTTKVVQKYAVNVGDGTTTAITITHNLGTLDVAVQVVEISTGNTVECDVTRPTTNTATLTFAVAPTSAQYRAIVHG